MNPCECGCGRRVKNRFLRGHHRRQNPVERFWKYTDKRSIAECWPWLGHIDRLGYGVFYDRFKSINAHRVSYALHYGEIAARQHVLHGCDNRACVNPNHLSLGSHRDNMVDMARKGRANKKLSIDNVREIRVSADMGFVLADRFGVDRSTISKIRSYNSRPHV